MKNRTKILLLTSLMTLITGCTGGGGGSSSDSSTRPISDGGGNPQNGSFSSLIASAPDGWKRDCMQGFNVWTKQEIKMQGNNIVHTITYYNDLYDFNNDVANYCVEERKFAEDRYTFTATTGDNNSIATNVDFTFSKVEMVSYNHASNYNMGQMCGKSDWVADQWKDVSSTSCADKRHQIFKVVDNRLYLGDLTYDLNGHSEEKRPTSLKEWGLLKSGTHGESNRNILDQIIQAGKWSTLTVSTLGSDYMVAEMEIVDGNFVTYQKVYQSDVSDSSKRNLVLVRRLTESIQIEGANSSIPNATNVRLVLLKEEEIYPDQSVINIPNSGIGVAKYTVFKISDGKFYQGIYTSADDGSTTLKRPKQLGIFYLMK